MAVHPDAAQPPGGTDTAGLGRPAGWPWQQTAALAPGETVVATARFDLDGDLQFTDGWLLLTDRRLLSDRPASAAGPPPPTGPHDWPLDPPPGGAHRWRCALCRRGCERA